MKQNFYKYEGAGNDFVMLDRRDGAPDPDAQHIVRLCDRRFGIGADGLITLGAPIDPALHCTMHYYNADGSPGEMCGNGGRCFALLAHHLGLGEGSCVRFRSTDGLHEAQIVAAKGLTGRITLGMIDVETVRRDADGYFLDTGVPHFVQFVEGLDRYDVVGEGRRLRYALDRFPQGTNVDFVEVAGPGHLRIRIYERGVENETLACGTGAVAAAIVAHLAGQPGVCDFCVEVPGGELGVRFVREGDTFRRVVLEGPARRVFEGEFETDNF